MSIGNPRSRFPLSVERALAGLLIVETSARVGETASRPNDEIMPAPRRNRVTVRTGGQKRRINGLYQGSSVRTSDDARAG